MSWLATLDFQLDVLRFLAQIKEGKRYLMLKVDDKLMLDVGLFDPVEYQAVFELLQGYTEKYGTQPSLSSMLEFFDISVARSKQKQAITKEVYAEIEKAIRLVYQGFQGDTTLIRERLIEYGQYRKTKSLFEQSATKLKQGPEIFRQVHKEMQAIVRMAEATTEEENTRGGFILGDEDPPGVRNSVTYPTRYRALNRLTSAGGFHSPQHIVLMGGPKDFKTGTLINIAMEYVRDGLNVYYADTENGVKSIRTRMKQQMIAVTQEELKTGDYDEELRTLRKRYALRGGDIYVRQFPPRKHTMLDVDADLQYLKDEFGWEPDCLIFDYEDLFLPMDKSIKDQQARIQAVYYDIIWLNTKRNTFAVGVSPVNKAAVEKAVLDMTDFAADFQKAYNAHAAFALCATARERELGIRRILPVVQREGVRYNGKNVCVVRIDEARMQMHELSFEEANVILQELEEELGGKESDKKKRSERKKAPQPQSLKALTDD